MQVGPLPSQQEVSITQSFNCTYKDLFESFHSITQWLAFLLVIQKALAWVPQRKSEEQHQLPHSDIRDCRRDLPSCHIPTKGQRFLFE